MWKEELNERNPVWLAPKYHWFSMFRCVTFPESAPMSPILFCNLSLISIGHSHTSKERVVEELHAQRASLKP
jgi:hypothetical protein